MINRDKSQPRVAASPALSAATEEQRKPPHLAPKAPRETSRQAFLPRLAFIVQLLAHSIFLCIPQSTVTKSMTFTLYSLKHQDKAIGKPTIIYNSYLYGSTGHIPSPLLKLFPDVAMLPQTQNVARFFILVRPQTYLLTSTAKGK